MVAARRARSATTRTVFAVVAVAAIALGIVVTSGLRFADAAGQPLGVPAVSITPSPVSGAVPSGAPDAKRSAGPTATAPPTSSPTASPTPGDDEPEVVTGPTLEDDEPEVVTGLPPVAVELDDHDGLRNEGSPEDVSGESGDSGGNGNSHD